MAESFDANSFVKLAPPRTIRLRSFRLEGARVRESEESDREKLVEKASGPGPPPDGGFVAWLQVLGAFFLNFNTW